METKKTQRFTEICPSLVKSAVENLNDERTILTKRDKTEISKAMELLANARFKLALCPGKYPEFANEIRDLLHKMQNHNLRQLESEYCEVE